jgi:CubicO group peptidase (beta-lactamase class C family)
MIRLVLSLMLVSASAGHAQSVRSAPFESFGPFLDSLMLEAEVPGASFAIFDDAGVVYEHAGGIRSRRSGMPVDGSTTFEAASISKPVFAYVVQSLVHDGQLDLDAPLGAVVDKIPELAYDPRSESLTPRILLSHQGGLPNWRSRLNFEAQSYSELFASDDTLRFAADPGSGYRYSGEGYVLLQRIVEERTRTGLTDLARVRVFEPLGMTRTSFQFDEETRRNTSDGHDREGIPDKWEIRLPLASSTLHTTASDLAKFGSHLASEIQREGPFASLAVPTVSIETGGGRDLAWGLGLGIVTEGERRYVYHGGNNVIFIADLLYGVDENIGYALLTNSSNGQRMIEDVERRVFGRVVRR